MLSSTEMVLYELKMKVDLYLLYRCLKLTSVCMLRVTCDNINYLAVCKYLRNDVQKAHVYSATQMQCKCNVSFHIVVVTGDLAVFVTSLVQAKLCLSQTVHTVKESKTMEG